MGILKRHPFVFPQDCYVVVLLDRCLRALFLRLPQPPGSDEGRCTDRAYASSGSWRSVALEREVDINLSVSFNRLPVQIIGIEVPLFGSFHRCLDQHEVPTQHSHV